MLEYAVCIHSICITYIPDRSGPDQYAKYTQAQIQPNFRLAANSARIRLEIKKKIDTKLLQRLQPHCCRILHCRILIQCLEYA